MIFISFNISKWMRSRSSSGGRFCLPVSRYTIVDLLYRSWFRNRYSTATGAHTLKKNCTGKGVTHKNYRAESIIMLKIHELLAIPAIDNDAETHQPTPFFDIICYCLDTFSSPWWLLPHVYLTKWVWFLRMHRMLFQSARSRERLAAAFFFFWFSGCVSR